GPDDAKGERQRPDRDADTKAGSNQAAALAHLEREVNRGEPADQTTDQQRRVHFSKKNAAPKTDENRGVKSVVASEQHAQEQRREDDDLDRGARVDGVEVCILAGAPESSTRDENAMDTIAELICNVHE